MKEPAVAFDKRRVTMTSYTTRQDDGGQPFTETHEAVDHVPMGMLDAYVADAKTRWQFVAVSQDTDHGPGGEDGVTHIPAHLDHPLAGQSFGKG